MNIADIVQIVLVSKKNPSIDDLLDYHVSKPIPINPVVISVWGEEIDDLPF